MTLFVGFLVEAEGLLAIRPVGNDRLGATLFQPLPQFGTVVGPVTEQPGGRPGTTDQTLGGRTIVRLAAAQEDGKKTAFSICDCVDLRIAPTS